MADKKEAILVGDVYTNIINPTSGKSENFKIVTTWYDGTSMSNAKVDGYLYRRKGSQYLRRVIDKDGELFLEKDTMAQMRALTSVEILLLKAGVYKGVTLNGYYSEGDTPAPIQYFLSTTSAVDDGGSVTVVGDIKLEHKFNVIYPEYFGAVGDGVADDTIPLQRSFAKLNTFKSIFINDDKRFRKTQHINIGSINNASIMGDGWIHNDDCDGITGFYDTCYGQLNVRLFNSDYTKNRFGLRVSGTKSRFNLKAYTDNLTSQYGTAIRFFDFTDNDITYQIHGNRMGLTDADTNTDIINTLKGKGAQVSYGINNTFTNCYSIYFAVGLDMPLEAHPTAGYANEGSMFSNCRFLWSTNNIWINVGTGLEFVNCMVDISRKESLIVNNVYRMTFTNSWISTVVGYSPWNVVIDNSRGVVFNNIMLGAGNANSMQVRNSQRCIFDNIVAKYDTSLPITNNIIIESTNNDCHVGRILGLNLINQSTSTTFISNTKRAYNSLIRDNDLGSGVVPTNTIVNSHGSRIASLDGETVNVFEVFGDSSSSSANNFQIGKTAKGLVVRWSGINGWETRLIDTRKSDAIRRGTTAQLPTGLNTTTDVGVLYYNTDLLAFQIWDGGNWRYSAPNATTSIKGVVNQTAYSADTATQASGANPTKAEFDALLAEFRDFKNKDRASGQSASS